MIKTLTAAMIVLALSAGAAMAKTAPCKDPNGKFIKCPAAAAATPAPAMKTPAASPAPMAAAKAARCTDAKGKFIKCGAASAPMAASASMAKPPMAAAPAQVAKAPPAPMAAPAKPAMKMASAKAVTPTASSAGAPAGATARCKDNSYSMAKGHSGACSRHGGVASWLQ